MGRKRVLIFGVTGQDGFYLTKLLLEKDYVVYGVARRTSTPNTNNIKPFLGYSNFQLISGDVTDAFSVYNILESIHPDECYNLAAMSQVGTSFNQPSLTTDVVYRGVLNILEAIRLVHLKDRIGSNFIKLYQASSSEMFGSSSQGESSIHGRYQNEDTSFSPNSPYAVAKLAAHHLVRVYRHSYGVFGSCGILMNHESPLRSEEFVTRKITKYVANLYQAIQYGIIIPRLKLGNIESYRDWMHAEDAVRGMYLIMQQDKPDDYVLASGETHSIKEFLAVAFGLIGIKDWQDHIEIDAQLYRPNEVPYLRGRADKAKRVLGWEPKISFDQLVYDMVSSDVANLGLKLESSKGVS